MTRFRFPHTIFSVATVGLVAVMGCARAATPGLDCPLAFSPYSSDTPLYDILINPTAKAVFDRDVPGYAKFVETLPPGLMTTALPSFAIIATPRSFASSIPISDAELTKLDADLAAVPITPESSKVRCARYDETPPELPAKLKPNAMLVFSKISGFRHPSAMEAAPAAMKALAERKGWSVVFTDNGAVFNPKDLKRFKVVVWNNVSGDALTLTQERAFRNYIEEGGGFAGFHGTGGDPFYIWPWYVEQLIGAQWVTHTGDPQFPPGKVIIDDPKDAIVRGLGGWTIPEEWYSFKTSPRITGAHILATVDESTYIKPDDHSPLRMGDHPVAWTRCVGNGRSFYTIIGHMPENYTEAHSSKLIERGITWAAGLGETQCHNGKEVKR